MGTVNHRNEDCDHGWAWAVLFALFCNNIILNVQFISVTIFYMTFLEVFGESRAYTSWYISLNGTVSFAAGSLASYLIPRIGTRKVLMIAAACTTAAFIVVSTSHSLLLTILCYGFLGGIGYGLMLTAGVAAVAQYFKKHLYKASTVSFVGGGFGSLIYGPLLEWLYTLYGWRGAALIFAGLSLHVFIIAATVFPPRKPIHLTKNGECKNDASQYVKLQVLNETKSNGDHLNNENGHAASRVVANRNPENGHGTESVPLTNVNNEKAATTAVNHSDNVNDTKLEQEKMLTARERITDINFWCLSFVAFTWSFSNTTFIAIFKDLAQSNGVEAYFQTAVIVSGISQVVSRILVSFLTFNQVILSFALTLLAGSAVLFSFIYAHTFWSLMISSTFVGMLLGSTFLMVPMSVGAVYGRREMPITYGYVLLCVALSSAIGPPLIGYLRDVSGSYNSGICVFVVMQMAGAAVAWFLHRRKFKKWFL